MTTKTALFALLALWGVAALPVPAAMAEAAAAENSEEAEPKRALVDRVWREIGRDDALPGVMRVFLSDGTLVEDSCWETYRLSQWRMTGDTALAWDEDGIEIAAEIASLTDAELVLRLALVGGETLEQRFEPASVPFVCPDMPR